MFLYDVAVVATLSCMFYAVWKIWKYFYDLIRLPPGPIGLPFVGVVNKWNPAKVTKTVQEWKDLYGDIFSFTLAGRGVVVVSSYDLIKEVLLTRSKEFAGRPYSFRAEAFFDFAPVVGFYSESPKIRMLKKTISTSLKMYGERLLQLEDVAIKALDEMMEHWKTLKGKPFDPQQSIHDVTGKIISSLTYGRFMTEEECKVNLKLQKDVIDVILAPGAKGQILEFLPWLRFFGNSAWDHLVHTKKRGIDFFSLLFEKSMALYDGKNPVCILHSFDLSQKKLKEENGGKDVLTDADVFNLPRALIGAGTSTTFRATHSFVAILTNNPELQRRLQQEVDEAVGDETPRLKDKEKMPYMEAAMFELLRYISHLPVLIPHAAMRDTTLGGYSIPKNTQIWINAFGLHHDPRYWDEPWEFKPERYLEEDGKVVAPDHPNRRRLLPFGAGRRGCPGEVLAKNRLFLMMAGIVQNFTFKPKSETERPDDDPRNYLPGLATHPKDFEIFAIAREKEKLAIK